MRTITRDIVGALLFSSDNKLLLGRTDPAAGGVYTGCWVIPGGGIEPGETKLEAMQREVSEETGLDIRSYEAKLVGDSATGVSEKTLKESGERVLVEMQFYEYEVRIPLPAAQIPMHPTEELIELEWFKVEDLGDVAVTPPMQKLLKTLGYIQ